MDETEDICLTCGKVLPDAIRTFKSPFFGEIRSQQIYCVECQFLAEFAYYGHKPRPYKLPVRRPTKEGRAPQSWLDEHRALLEKERAPR